MRVLTPEQVKRVGKRFDVDFIKKNSSEIMQIAARIVPIFSKIKPNEFMEYYVTTLFDNIYYTEADDLEFDLVTHELTHVMQFRNGSFVRYVTLAGRGYLEGMSKCAEIELDIATNSPYDIDEKSERLYDYGLGKDEVNVVKSMLLSTERSFKETGNFSSEISKYLVEMYNEPIKTA